MSKTKEPSAAAAAVDPNQPMPEATNGQATAKSAVLNDLVAKARLKLKHDTIEIEGNKLVVHEMDYDSRMAFLAQLGAATKDGENIAGQLAMMQGQLIQQTVTEENGTPLLSDPADIKLLGQLHPDWVELLYQKSFELNQLNRKDAEVAAEKN